jgi:hypothetical protein
VHTLDLQNMKIYGLPFCFIYKMEMNTYEVQEIFLFLVYLFSVSLMVIVISGLADKIIWE